MTLGVCRRGLPRNGQTMPVRLRGDGTAEERYRGQWPTDAHGGVGKSPAGGAAAADPQRLRRTRRPESGRHLEGGDGRGPGPLHLRRAYRGLFRTRYPAPGSPQLAALVQHTLKSTESGRTGNGASTTGRGRLFAACSPAADIPVVQLSLDRTQGRRAPLRACGAIARTAEKGDPHPR